MEAFKRVEAARAKGRPTGYDFISNILTGFLQLHGDRRFGDDQAVVARDWMAQRPCGDCHCYRPRQGYQGKGGAKLWLGAPGRIPQWRCGR